MNRVLLGLAATFLLTIVVQAQDAPAPAPLPAQARQAETKFNGDMQKLDADYEQKAVAIKQAYVDDLKTALKNLAKQDNPDPEQIAKLSAKIKEVQATGVVPPIPSQNPAKGDVPRVIGRWKVEWGGSSIEKTINNDNTTSDKGVWLQDGFKVIIISADGHNADILSLSADGKTISGFNQGSKTHVTYEFLGGVR